PHMRTGTAEMVEDLVFGTVSVLKSISQHGEAVVVEGAGGQGAIFVSRRHQCRHSGRPPSTVEGDGAEEQRAKNIPKEGSQSSLFALPTSDSPNRFRSSRKQVKQGRCEGDWVVGVVIPIGSPTPPLVHRRRDTAATGCEEKSELATVGLSATVQ